MIASTMSLAVHAGRQPAFDPHQHVLRLAARAASAWRARARPRWCRCRAPARRRRRASRCASRRRRRSCPGRVAPCSGPMTWTMPWRLSFILNWVMPKRSQLASSVSTCSLRDRIGDAAEPGRWSARCGRLTPDWPKCARPCGRRQHQAVEGLRAGHFVDQVPVDVEHGRAVLLGVNDVFVPDLVVQRADHRRLSSRR